MTEPRPHAAEHHHGDDVIPPVHDTGRGANRVLVMSSIDFTVMFAVWLMFGILGIEIQKELRLDDVELSWIDVYKRQTMGTGRDVELAAAVGMTPEALEQMYRLLAIAKYDERYVIPKAHREEAHNLEELACSLDFEGGPGMYEAGPFGEASGRPVPVAIETYTALKQRQQAEDCLLYTSRCV